MIFGCRIASGVWFSMVRVWYHSTMQIVCAGEPWRLAMVTQRYLQDIWNKSKEETRANYARKVDVSMGKWERRTEVKKWRCWRAVTRLWLGRDVQRWWPKDILGSSKEEARANYARQAYVSMGKWERRTEFKKKTTNREEEKRENSLQYCRRYKNRGVKSPGLAIVNFAGKLGLWFRLNGSC